MLRYRRIVFVERGRRIAIRPTTIIRPQELPGVGRIDRGITLCGRPALGPNPLPCRLAAGAPLPRPVGKPATQRAAVLLASAMRWVLTPTRVTRAGSGRQDAVRHEPHRSRLSRPAQVNGAGIVKNRSPFSAGALLRFCAPRICRVGRLLHWSRYRSLRITERRLPVGGNAADRVAASAAWDCHCCLRPSRQRTGGPRYRG